MNQQPQQQTQKTNDFFRFDSFLAKQSISLVHTFQDSSELILDILYYISKLYQYDFNNYLNPDEQLNLFYKDELDMAHPNVKIKTADFAKQMKYDRSNLQHLHPFPEELRQYYGATYEKEYYRLENFSFNDLLNNIPQHLEKNSYNKYLKLYDKNKNKSGLPEYSKKLHQFLLHKGKLKLSKEYSDKYKKDTHLNSIFNTYLDNAIYKMATKPIVFRFDLKHKRKQMIHSSVEGYKLAKKAIKSGNPEQRKAIAYSIFFNRDIEETFNTFFINHILDNEVNQKLRNNHLRYFFNYIKSLETTLKHKGIYQGNIHINTLSELFKLDDLNYSEKQQYSKRRQRIKDKIHKTNQITGSNYSILFPKNDRYQGHISFDTNNHISDHQQCVQKAFDDKLIHSLREQYIYKYEVYKNIFEFHNWLKDPSKDYQMKCETFKKVAKETKKKEPNHVDINYFNTLSDKYNV